jgi:hypothetical protein
VAVSGNDQLRALAGGVFRGWRTGLSAVLQRSGLEPGDADRLAGTVLAAVEGALVLARAEGDVAVYDAVVEDLVRLARAAAGPARPGR